MIVRIMRILYSILALATIFACGKAEIEIYADELGGVLIINEDTLVLDADSVIRYEISSGKHHIEYNDQILEEFRITKQGGLLNLGRRRFVRLVGTYKASGGYGFESHLNLGDYELSDFNKEMNLRNKISSTALHDMVAIDSNIFIVTDDAEKITERELSLYLRDFEEFSKDGKDQYNSMKLIDSNIFISKDWNYGLTEEFPDELESDYRENTYRTKIMDESMFLLAAIFNTERIRIVTIEDQKNVVEIQPNKYDSIFKR